jgi:methylglyoxal synthase
MCSTRPSFGTAARSSRPCSCGASFVDPLSPHPHDVDVKALTRLALVYDIPLALNRATAERLIGTLSRT